MATANIRTIFITIDYFYMSFIAVMAENDDIHWKAYFISFELYIRKLKLIPFLKSTQTI